MRKRQDISQVIVNRDNKTGELLDVVGDYVPYTKRRYNGKFLLFYGENFIPKNMLTLGRIQIIMQTEKDNILKPTSSVLEDISKKYSLSIRILEDDVTQLQKCKIITRISAGIYMVNPYLFIRGDRKKIPMLINTWKQLVIENNDKADTEKEVRLAKKNAKIKELETEVGDIKIMHNVDNLLYGDNNG